MVEHVSVLILGAGPTGLGAAYRLHEKGSEDWLLLEKNAYPGGLATTFTDKQGFLWDVGGHVVHSHYKYFDQVFAKHILKQCNKLQREAWVWLKSTFVPYPFQYNLHYLPKKIQDECIAGLKNLQKKSPKNFHDWILANFGDGIARHFLFPLNRKTWGIPLEKMNTAWMRDRVATVDVKRTLRNIRLKKDDVAWGPNHVFYFPKKGGTGSIWKRIATALPAEKLHFNSEVVHIDPKRKIVTTRKGKTYHYDTLISSLPLTTLLKISRSPLAALAKKSLKASTVHIVGLGLKGKTPTHLRTKCWMYFPEKNLPFFRATVFSNYAKNNVPQPGKQWSLMFEITQKTHTPTNIQKLVDQVISGAMQAQLIKPSTPIVSTWHYQADLGYPIPTLTRDPFVDQALQKLQQQGIYSRGRFGAWKYEVSNMDHSFMQGVEAVNHIMHHHLEMTVHSPQVANQ